MLEYQDALDIVGVAVRKQLLKKVIVVRNDKTDEPIDFRCPICNTSLLGGVYYYCGRCGQHIDWKDATGTRSL